MRHHTRRPPSPAVRSLCLAAATALPCAAQCEPQLLPGEPLGVPGGTASSLEVWDPDGGGPAPDLLVVGGQSSNGAMGSVLAYDGTQWQALGTPPAGVCTALGQFGGRLLAAFSRSSIASDVAAFDGAVWQVVGAVRGVAHTMTVYQGALVVGGTFSHVNGLPTSNVARWDGSTWSPLGVGAGGVGGTVLALADYFGSLYVGGDIPHASGIPTANLAVWNGSAWSAGARFDGIVRALRVRNTSATTTSFLFAAGEFGTVAGIASDRVARFNLLSGWSQAGTGLPSGTCSALYVRPAGLSSYELIVGMQSTSVPVARSTGSTWTPLGSGRSGSVAALTLFGGRYAIAHANSTPLVRVLDGAGAWLPPSGPGLDGLVATVHATAGDLVIGGSFTSISGVRMNGIARGGVGAWQALGGGVTGGGVSVVTTMPDGDVVAAGDFTAAGGVGANHIARWDGSGWSALGSGITGTAHALASLPNGDLVVAGSLTHAGGQPVGRIAAWDGSAWRALGSGMDGTVFCLAVHPNGELFAGGFFDTAGGVAARGLARWNGTSWSPLAGSPNAGVQALAVLTNGELLVGGFFYAVGSVATNYVARWNGSGWVPVPGFSQSLFSGVHALVALPGGQALVAGVSAAQPPSAFFARFDGQAVVPLAPARFFFSDGALAQDGAAFLVIGSTHRLVSPCTAVVRRYGQSCLGSGGANVLSAEGLPWIGNAFRCEATGMPALGLVLGITGVAETSIPIRSFLRQGTPGCDLLAAPDLVTFLQLRAGSAASVLQIPSSSALVGQILHHQVLALELDGGSQVIAATSTNGLRLTVGAF